MTDTLQTLLDDALGTGETTASDAYGDNVDRTERRVEQLVSPVESPASEPTEQPPQ